MRVTTQLTRKPPINRTLLAVFLGLGLTAAPAASQQSPDGLVFRRVWTSSAENPGVGGFPPVRGRFFSMLVGNAQDLAIYDLAEDRVEVLTDRWADRDSADMTGGPLLSPDGTRLVYRYTHWGENGGEVQLRMINRDGSGERILLQELLGMNDAGTNFSFQIQPLAWMPDGATIIAEQHVPGTTEIVLVSARDGSRRTVGSYDVRAIGRLDLSADGRFAAFDLAVDDNGNRDIHAVDLETGSSWALVGGNGNDQLMGWDPDGSGIFFYSNRELGGGIWKLSVRDGRAVGEPVLVRGDVWDMLPIGFSGNQFFYRVSLAQAQIRTASVDIAAGHVITPPTMIRPPTEGWSRDPAWSPDVRHLAFLDYPGGNWALSSGRLAIRSVYTGETRYLEFPFLAGATLHWTENGLLVVGTHDGVSGIYRLDLSSGDVSLLQERPREGWNGLTISPDGRTYYFHRDNSEILARDIATGSETLLGRIEGVTRRMGISPDGSTLAMRVPPDLGMGGHTSVDSRLFVLPTAGGEAREIYQGEALRATTFLEFTPDNRYVVGASFWQPEGVWRIPVDGSSEPLKILEGEAPRSFRLSSDGRRIAYWDWQDPEGSTELWVIEGLVGSGR
jgi:Tol biopolymer transport system component